VRPALLVDDLRSGGAERLVRDLAVQFQTLADVDPLVVTGDDLGGYKSDLAAAGVEVVTLDASVTAETLPASVGRLSTLLDDAAVDLLHSHRPQSHLVGRLACARRAVPHVATYHHPLAEVPLRRRLTERATARFSERLVCVSEGVRQASPWRRRAVVVYSGIDAAAFRAGVAAVPERALPTAHAPGDTVYLNVARCVSEKRQCDLVEAVARLDADDVHLYVVGDGPLREELTVLVADLGVGDRVTVTGFVEDVAPYYAAADVYVSAAGNEGLPTSHLEAMAAELRVVSTAISGVTELVEHGVNGYLCPVGSPPSLADRMRDVRGPGADGFAATGLDLVRREFSLSRAVDEHLALYAELS
jgi:glycosyltransferase involved in cell wall biosynthesis